ncbi:proline-rich protein 2-like [Panthera pardus]|uniref:Proline-rich protein 2-like n=1 Tax=Panthera pardus TaxID=9691 RepID=A0A9W2VDC2_PANPR|nr:proline-rich protein 2-like [Panthera leo]XP_053756614.1 proline-rich protein 2-like [Panthera pardus]
MYHAALRRPRPRDPARPGPRPPEAAAETPSGPPPPSRGRDRGTPHAPDPALPRPQPRDPALRRPQPRDPAARPQRPGPRPPEAAAEGPGGPAPRTLDPATRTPPSGDRNRRTPHLRSRARNPALQRLQPTCPRGDAERAALPESDRRGGGGGRNAFPGSSALTPLAREPRGRALEPHGSVGDREHRARAPGRGTRGLPLPPPSLRAPTAPNPPRTQTGAALTADTARRPPEGPSGGVHRRCGRPAPLRRPEPPPRRGTR